MSDTSLAVNFFSTTTLSEMHKALSEGTLKSVDLVTLSLALIEQHNEALNAFVYVNVKGALKEAALLDAEAKKGILRGALHGIPIAIKDNIFTKDQPTSMGSALFEDFSPPNDAECVRLLREAGAIIIGKTVTHEFAYGPTGDCSFAGASKNPLDPSKMTGGSSAGSAAAVAISMVPVAIGTDTGGSVRIPSSLCGVSGFKPTFNTIDIEGVYPLSSSLDCVGILANTSEDIQLVYDVLMKDKNGKTEKTKKASSSKKIQLGWLNADAFIACDATVMDVVQRVVETLPFTLVDVDAEDLCQGDMLKWYAKIQGPEAFAVHAEQIITQSEKYQKEVLERLFVAKEIQAWEYIQALQEKTTLAKAYAVLFKQCDILIMPTLPIIAPDLYVRALAVNGEIDVPVRDLLLSYTCPWSVVGFPAYTLRCGFLDAMPVGLQLIANKGEDALLLDTAQVIEAFLKQ